MTMTTTAQAQEVVTAPPRTDGLEQGYTLDNDSAADDYAQALYVEQARRPRTRGSAPATA
jgi:hypothetical protein